MGYYNKNEVIFLTSKKKTNNLIALNYFIWEESKPEHMRRTIDSQILFIESCRFFIFDTLFQEFTFAKKKPKSCLSHLNL